MKFGKCIDLSGIDFSIPELPAFTPALLDLQKTNTSPVLYYGCTAWGMPEWKGKYYPPKSASKDFLYHYSRQFSTIELNTTHYRIPTIDMVQNWYDQSDSGFLFCPKIPQMISHSGDLGLHNDYTAIFCERIAGLKEKLGTSFMQLPPHFGPEKLKTLERFLMNYPVDIAPLSIELRNEQWFETAGALDDFLALLQSFGVGTVWTDVAGRRDVLHMGLSNTTIQLRFVGNDDPTTDQARIDDWVVQLKALFDLGVQQLYFFGHQPDNLFAPELCSYFLKQALQGGLPVRQQPKLYENPQLGLF